MSKEMSIFNHFMRLENWAQTGLWATLTWLQAGAHYLLWQKRCTFFSSRMEPHWGEVQMSAVLQSELSASVLRWGSTRSQVAFQRASFCQSHQSRVQRLPETGQVWLSSCYWLLFFFFALSRFKLGSFSRLPAVRGQTVQNHTPKHSRTHWGSQLQTVVCHLMAIEGHVKSN